MFKQSSLFANVATSLSRTDLMFRTGGARMSGRTFGGSLNMKRCETMWNDVKRCETMWNDVKRCETMWTSTIYHYLSLSRYYHLWCSRYYLSLSITVNDVLYAFVVSQRKQARTESADLHGLDRFRQCLLHSVRASTLSVATGIVRLKWGMP